MGNGPKDGGRRREVTKKRRCEGVEMVVGKGREDEEKEYKKKRDIQVTAEKMLTAKFLEYFYE